VSYTAPRDARGDRPLSPPLENGVKVLDLDASVIRWNILSGTSVTAYAINRQVPGPRLELTEGLYGALIILPQDSAAEPKAHYEYVVQLQEWLFRDGLTYPAMLMEGALPNYFTINGKAWPATDTLHMRVGETVKFRFIGTNNNFIHPMHMHGGPFTVVARDGTLLRESARFDADVINVGPGQRYDVIWPAREPGKWILHCHIPHHTLNNNVEERGAGGLTLLVDVTR
jgi:FtsP/CotA-like multicopper oxidase with cupredoxin domain